MEETKRVKYRSDNISSYSSRIDNSVMECQIHWARVISSESESLFTQYTKHTFYELQYALEGCISMTVGERQSVHIAERDFIVIPPDTYHQIVGGDTAGARFIMAFSIRFKSENFKKYEKYLNRPVPHAGNENMYALFSLLLSQNTENIYGTPVRRQLVSSLLESFVLKIIECVLPNGEELNVGTYGNNEDKRISEICAFIHSREGLGIRVSDVAERFGITERHLNRILQNGLGKGPRELINYEKLKKIEALTVTTSLSFTEISELCGFSDEYAMNKFFRRSSHINLSEFRKIQQKKR